MHQSQVYMSMCVDKCVPWCDLHLGQDTEHWPPPRKLPCVPHSGHFPPGLPSVTTDWLWLSWSFTLLSPSRVCSSVSRFFQHVVKIHPCRHVYHQSVPLGCHEVIHSMAVPQSTRSPADGHLGVPRDGASPFGHGCVGFLWASRVSL